MWKIQLPYLGMMVLVLETKSQWLSVQFPLVYINFEEQVKNIGSIEFHYVYMYVSYMTNQYYPK